MDFLQVSSASCLATSNYYTTFSLMMLMPFIVMALLSIGYLVHSRIILSSPGLC